MSRLNQLNNMSNMLPNNFYEITFMNEYSESIIIYKQ